MSTITKTRGYILLYSLIVITLFATIAASVVVSTVRDLENTTLEVEALKAGLAASSGLECVTKWQSVLSYDTNAPATTTTCHTGGYGTLCDVTGPASGTLVDGDCRITTVGGDPAQPCTAGTPIDYNIRYGPLGSSDGPCVEIKMRVRDNAANSLYCDIDASSRGYSDCGANPIAERSFWATF